MQLEFGNKTGVLPMDVMMSDIIGYAVNNHSDAYHGPFSVTIKYQNGSQRQTLSIPLSKYCTGRDLKRIGFTMTDVFPKAGPEDEAHGILSNIRVLYPTKGNEVSFAPVLDLLDNETLEECGYFQQCPTKTIYVTWINGNQTEPLLVCLKLLRTTLQWTAPPFTKIADLKEYIANHEGYSDSCFLVTFFFGEPMHDTMYLTDYGVQRESTIHVLNRCPMPKAAQPHFEFGLDKKKINAMLFPTRIAYDVAMNIDGLTLQDDFGPLEVISTHVKMNSHNNKSQNICEFSRPVVNPMFFATSTNEKDPQHKYCETWNVNLQVTHQGVRYSIPYSCFH
eukprot:PhF_6_TR7023/c0_g2_i12/m.10488